MTQEQKAVEEPYIPKTDLGRRLLALREQAIAGGMKLMSEDEIRAEIRSRRGEEPDEASP